MLYGDNYNILWW